MLADMSGRFNVLASKGARHGSGQASGKPPICKFTDLNGDCAKLVQRGLSSCRLEVQGCFVTCAPYSLLAGPQYLHMALLHLIREAFVLENSWTSL